MHSAFQKIIQQTLDASHLSDEEKAELERELRAHILDHARELELNGYSEKEIIETITRAFGDTEEIGQQLFLVHRRFERIPWIGPLLYYRPFTLGVQLFVIHCIVLFVWFSKLFFVLIAVVEQRFNHYYSTVDGVTGMLQSFDVAPPFIIAFITIIPLFEGIWAAIRVQSRSILFESFAVSYIPIFFFLFSYLLNQVLEHDDIFIDRQEVVTQISIVIGVHVVLFYIGAEVYWFIKRRIERKKLYIK